MNDDYNHTKEPDGADWTISDPNLNFRAPAAGGTGEILTDIGAEDWATNAPKTNPSGEINQDGWKMPEPFFRISEGKKLEKSARTEISDASPAEQFADNEKKTTNAIIQPQPHISEEFVAGNSIGTQPVKGESKTSKTAYLIFGLIAMVVFAIIFLISVYFLFFYGTDV